MAQKFGFYTYTYVIYYKSFKGENSRSVGYIGKVFTIEATSIPVVCHQKTLVVAELVRLDKIHERHNQRSPFKTLIWQTCLAIFI